MRAPLPSHETLTAADIETRFAVSRNVDYPFLDFASEQQQRLYKGGLQLAGDFEGESDVDWQPYNVVIDGDLIVDGNVSWFDASGGSYVLVTGDVRCRNLILDGNVFFVVRGDLVVTAGILGCHGDDGGELVVEGATRAQVVVNTSYYNMTFASPPAALVCGDPDRTSCKVDFADDDLGEVLVEKAWNEGGYVEEDALEKLLRKGKSVLRPGVTRRK